MSSLKRAEQLRQAIHNYFREFGPETAEEIYAQLLKPGGMGRLLGKLSLSDPGDSAQQYEAIYHYLKRQGSAAFLRQLGGSAAEEGPRGLLPLDSAEAQNHKTAPRSTVREYMRLAKSRAEQSRSGRSSTGFDKTPSHSTGRAQQPPADHPGEQQAFLQHDDKTELVDRRVLENDLAQTRPEAMEETPSRMKTMERVSIRDSVAKLRRLDSPGNRDTSTGSAAGAPTSPPRELRAPTPQPVLRPSDAVLEATPQPAPKSPPPAEPAARNEPAPSATPQPAPMATPADKKLPPGTLPDGSWDGVTERRSGADRRSGTDRRQQVDVVYQNRRYGGDRRSKKERRHNWPPREWPIPGLKKPGED
ncbi:MAG: hypothetical protein RLY93_12470 [Sumerlaeia bacterium]